MTINGRFVVLLIVLAFVSYYSYVYDSVSTPTGIVTISEPVYPHLIIPLDENEILDAKEFLVQVGPQRNLTACKRTFTLRLAINLCPVRKRLHLSP